MAIISVSLPESLVKQLDALIEARGFAGRSEALRAASRDFIAKELQDHAREGQRSATVTVVYPEGHERRISDIRHGFGELIKSMMHAHAQTSCVEVFLVNGKATRIREFTDRLRAYKEARLVQAIYTDVDEGPPQ